jgi:hypothetical protein
VSEGDRRICQLEVDARQGPSWRVTLDVESDDDDADDYEPSGNLVMPRVIYI